MAPLNLRFTISPNVIFQEVQLGESMLLDVTTVKYFAFDPLGTRIWLAMQQTDNADRVLNSVAVKSEMSMEDLERILRGILAGLDRSGLITLTDQSGSQDLAKPVR